MDKRTVDGNLSDISGAAAPVPVNAVNALTDLEITDDGEPAGIPEEAVEQAKREVDDNHK